MVGQRVMAFLSGMMSASLCCTSASAFVFILNNGAISAPYSETQESPQTLQEYDEAIKTHNAGLSVDEAFLPQPHLYREYTSYLVDIWDDLFVNDYTHGESGLVFDEWVSNGDGIVQGENIQGEPLTSEILFSLEIPQDDRVFSQEALEQLDVEGANFRFGIAFVELQTSSGFHRAFSFWTEVEFTNSSPQNEPPSTLLTPLSEINEHDWSNLTEVKPVLVAIDDFDWESADEVGQWNIFQDYQDAVERAAVNASVSIITSAASVVTTAVAAGAVTAAAGGAGLTAVVIGLAAGAAGVVGGALFIINHMYNEMQRAIDELRDDMVRQGILTRGQADAMSDEQILHLGQLLF